MAHDLSSLQTDWLRVARRENNTKRSYLLVNPLQAKHMPVAPSKALALFSTLADQLRRAYPHDRFLVVGFAETATAIGAAVAAALDAPAYYVHTTRETLPGLPHLVDFHESHSHAVEQILYCPQWPQWIAHVNHILFVEDELTTGNTLLNFVQALSERALLPDSIAITAASLVNGMQEAHMKRFREQNIACHFLFSLDHVALDEALQQHGFGTPEADRSPTPSRDFTSVQLHGKPEPRFGLSANAYPSACLSFAQRALSSIPPFRQHDSVLVLGTEECMYPAIMLGHVLEKSGHCVLTHATTRSPIEPHQTAGYPLFERHSLPSVYDRSRQTFLYNLAPYDRVIIVTDAAPEKAEFGLQALAGALQHHACPAISVVHWLP